MGWQQQPFTAPLRAHTPRGGEAIGSSSSQPRLSFRQMERAASTGHVAKRPAHTGTGYHLDGAERLGLWRVQFGSFMREQHAQAVRAQQRSFFMARGAGASQAVACL